MRPIRWPRRRRNRLLSICLRFLTPGNAPSPGACLALLRTVLGPNSAGLWHGGAKIFHGVMTKRGKEGKEMKGDTGSDGSGAAVPHCYDLAIG